MDCEAQYCVLLVDCNADHAQATLAALTGSGNELRVECVSGLSDALERVGQNNVASIIVDLKPPGARGLELFEAILSATTHIPILVLADADNEVAARQALERGAYDYLLKNDLPAFRLRRIVRSMIDQHREREATFLQQQCAEAALACTGEAVVISDLSRRVTYLNGAAEQLTGWVLNEALGQSLDKVLHIAEQNERPENSNTLLGALAEDKYEELTGNCTLIHHGGTELRIKKAAVSTHDRAGNIVGSVTVFHDVGAARAMTLELSHLAQHDFLTDLPNRVLLNDRIKQGISSAERYNKQLAVMYVDLDHFKKINDTYGHAVGDKLLQLVGTRILSCVRRSDTVSRQGGDEFIVLLSEVGHAEDAVFIARKILRSLAAPFPVDQKHLCLSGSIGVSTYPGDGLDAETLIHKADTALYEAKKLGRHNYQFFRTDMQARVLEWQSLEGNLRNALGRKEFKLHYQPKIDLKTGEISGVEALIRWQHPEHGLVQPLQFVPIAEESGLIVPIGQWALLEACRQAQAWIEAGLPAMRMAVNVSALQFMNADFLAGVRAALQETGVAPGNLELELTETVLMHDADSAIKTLNELKNIGVQLAVDDFGTGYSSFSYLRRFPLDTLKVDRSFINEITPDSNNATILSALISIGKSLNHRVVAEGVETQEQVHFLQRQECTEAQGFFFCHPVIAQKFAEFLQVGVGETVVH